MTINGQILAESSFAFYINMILKNNTINSIVEIGTWKGLGSTKRIIDSIIQYNLACKFISLETNLEFFQIAQENLKDYIKYVQLIHGSIVTLQDIDKYLFLNPIRSIQQSIWLQQDIHNILSCSNIIELIPSKIDFLLLDGGEFSTYAEWQLLKDRSHIIALDDTKTMKCILIKEEILKNNNYEIIIDSDDRNGFMFVRNLNYVT